MSIITTDHEEEFVSVAEVAGLVGLSECRIRQLCTEGRISFKQFGRYYMIPATARDKFVSEFEPSNRGRPRKSPLKKKRKTKPT